MARPITVNIGGEKRSIDLDDALHIHDADAERHTVAADMAEWGILAAAAEARVQKLTAAAASWHAKALATIVANEDKISEWKAKAIASGDAQHLQIQNDIADAQEQAGRANTIHWAYVRKMEMLQAMIVGANQDARAAKYIGHQSASSLPDTRMEGFKQRRSANKPGSKEE